MGLYAIRNSPISPPPNIVILDTPVVRAGVPDFSPFPPSDPELDDDVDDDADEAI
jgi:hypothetical protein